MTRYTKLFIFSLIACVLLLGFVKTEAVNFERPLTVGSTGSDVSTLQQILKDLGLFDAQVTGFFGPVTQTAVEAFQTKYSLASQGIVGYGFVGPKTRELLNTFTPSSTHTPSSPTTQAVSIPTISISRDLYVGLQGEDVRQLQSFLKERGYFNHPQITGYFGEVTRNAVIAFQQANGINALGRVGPQTRAKIVNTINAVTSTVSTTQNTVQNSVVTRPAVRSGIINNNSTVPNLVVTVSDNDADNAVAQNQDLTYTLTIDNTGDGLATGVDLTDTISGDVGNVGTFGFSNCGSSYTNNSTGSTVSIDNVEIAVATNCVITYHVSVDSDATDASTITNSADVSAATEGGNNPSAVTADTLTVDVTTLPTLSVTVSENDADNSVTPNQSITYTIAIENTGETDAITSLTASIPTDMGTPGTYNYTTCGTPSPSFSSPTLTISSIDINSGVTCTITFVIAVDTPLNEGTTLVVSVDVAEADEGGNDPMSTSASTLTVDATPALSVTSAEDDADDSVSQDQDITYTLTIDNTGDGLATGVDLTDTIAGDVGNVGTFSFSNCGSSYTNNSTGSTVSIDNLEIAVATNCVITYHVSVDSDATDASTITNNVDVGVATEGGNNPSATGASTLTVDAPLAPFWADGQSVGNLTSTADWQEISGITNPTVAANANYIWMQSDGSIDKIFAVNTSNAASAGEWTLSGINGSDYEDLSSARVDDESYIYLADMGDNANARSTIIIYRIKEPTVTGSNGTVDAGDIEAITMEYPAGSLPTHKDAETLLVDPDTGDMYIITKRESVPGVYYLAHQASYSGTQTLTDLGNMYDIPDVGSISATGNAVGGNISPNGEEILIKSYNVMYLFPRDKGTQTIYQALQQTPTVVEGYVGGGNTTYRKSHPSQEPQGEAVTFDYDGNHYYTASEFASTEGSTASRFPLFKYARASETPTTATFQEGASSYAGTSDTYIWDGTVTPSNSSTVRGTETTIVVDTTTVANNDERKGLLKFDISSIPSNATIIGAHLDLYISTEGQGWKMHRVLVDWNESSTYDTLTGGIDDDNTDASTVEDNRNGVTLDGITGSIVNNMKLATVQGWVDGTYNNYGWLIEGTDLTTGDGQQFVSSEGVTSTQRPKLTVRYTTP